MYSAILCFQADPLCSHHMRLGMLMFSNIYQSSVPRVLFGSYMASTTSNCCHLGTLSVDIIQSCIHLQCHLFKAMYIPFALLANDLDLSYATVVTQRWNGYPAGTWTNDLPIMSLAFCHWAIPTPFNARHPKQKFTLLLHLPKENGFLDGETNQKHSLWIHNFLPTKYNKSFKLLVSSN